PMRSSPACDAPTTAFNSTAAQGSFGTSSRRSSCATRSSSRCAAPRRSSSINSRPRSSSGRRSILRSCSQPPISKRSSPEVSEATVIEFALSPQQQTMKEGINQLGKYVIRPMSLEMDRNHEVPEPFLRNFMKLAKGFRNEEALEPFSDDGLKKKRDPSKPSEG